MKLSKEPYKGTRDFYPEDEFVQKYMFNTMRKAVERFGYAEYDASLLEETALYKAKTGEEIVNEQTYSFVDRGQREVTIRPEMTPSVSRMVAGRRQDLAYPLRWYSIPNLWRYERPQRGRLREHWQLNVDIFGVADISADHEIILIADSLMKAFKAPAGSYEIRISSRKLVDYFFRDILKLNDQQFHDASKLIDRWHKIEIPDFETQLKESEVEAATFDFSVIRGMDYYDDIIFEVFDTSPENNRSMFGGGRYDGLVAAFGVEPVPTVGFGMGDVTLQNFLELHKLLPKLEAETDAVVILIGDVYEA